MKYSTIELMFTIVLTLVPGLVFAENLINDSKPRGYLFVIKGASGFLDGEFLDLSGVPKVVDFSESPTGHSGRMSLSDFKEILSFHARKYRTSPVNPQPVKLSVLNKDRSIGALVDYVGPKQSVGDLIFAVVKIAGLRKTENFKNKTVLISTPGCKRNNYGLPKYCSP